MKLARWPRPREGATIGQSTSRDSQSAGEPRPAAPLRNEPATRARTFRQWRDLVVVGYSHAGQHAYIAGVGIAIPFIVAAFHVSYAVIGVALAIIASTGSLWQIAALVTRRTSSRVLLFAQDVGSTLGAVISALAPGIAVFMAGRLVQAWSTWPQHPIGSAYLANRHPRRRGTILSWHVTAGNVGTLVTPLALTSVIAAGGWRDGFWLLAALLATTAVVVGVGMDGRWRTTPRLEGARGEGGDATAAHAQQVGHSHIPAGWHAAWHELVAMIRQRPLATLLAAGALAAGGQGIGILSVYLPSYLKSSLRLSPFDLGAVMTVVYVGAVVGPVAMGHLSDRLGHHGVLLANYLLGAAALAGVVLAGSALGALAGVGLAVGVFSYSELSLRQTLFSDHLGRSGQRAGFGLFFAVSQSLGAAWVAITGILVTDVGFHVAIFTMAGTFLAAAAVVMGGIPRAPRHQHANGTT